MLITFRALKVSYSDEGEGGVAVNCEKIQFFLNTLYLPGGWTQMLTIRVDQPFTFDLLMKVGTHLVGARRTVRTR